MAMPTVTFYRERYCKRVAGDLPDDRELEDVLGVLKSRVAKALTAQVPPAWGTPAWNWTPHFNIPCSPPSSRLMSASGERSFHLGINKPVDRAARSFDRYAASKGAIAAAIEEEVAQPDREPAASSIYDAYAFGHGGGAELIPDHYTNLSSDPESRAAQWDAIEQSERSLRLNCNPGPPRIAIFYERAPALFDRAAAMADCPDGLRKLIMKEQRRVAAGKTLSDRKQKLGVEWIDDAAPGAQAWLERLPGWDASNDKDRRLSRYSQGRGVLTHVAGEIEYPAILASNANARRNIRMGLAAWLDAQRNKGVAIDQASFLPMAIFDHLPDALNDRRNVHLHFLIGTRRVTIGGDGELAFAENKIDAIWKMGFVERLRGKFAELANVELERAAAGYMLHPGTHAQMGIVDAQANKKLHGRATVLERAGVPTTNGLPNDIENWRRRFERARKRHEARLAEIEKAAASEAAKEMMRRAAMLRFEAEEIGLLVGMAVSRAKRTVRFAPAYAQAAKRNRDRAGWLERAREAQEHLAMLARDLAAERAGIVERRREAARLDRAARDLAINEEIRAFEAALARQAAHRAVDDIARTPLLLTERNGALLVDRRDDPDGLILGIDLADADIQKRLRGQHAAQRKALAQVRSWIHKHGYDALFDPQAVRGSEWMRRAIEQWRASPIIKREENERRERAAAHRAMLVERQRRWADPEAGDIDEHIATRQIVLLPAEEIASPADVDIPAPVVPFADLQVPKRVERSRQALPWQPQPAAAVPREVAARWREHGMDRFATDITGFEHILSSRPHREHIADGRLADALGQDAARLTEPAIYHRLLAIWLYQDMTRQDLIAMRAIPHSAPDPAIGSGSVAVDAATIHVDRVRHANDGVLARTFEELPADGETSSKTRLPNRLFRATLAALDAGESKEACRLLADAALAQPGSLSIRRFGLLDVDDARIWGASSMEPKGIMRRRPGQRRTHGRPPISPSHFPGR